MYRVFSCLATEHDYWLVALAAVVCVSTTLTSFMTYSLAVACRDVRRLGWAVLTGVCAGSGIWATHFVAMLAYDGGFPTAYDPVATLASLLLAITLATAGFALSARQGQWSVGAGGLIIGAAIGCMHYVGMGALIVPGSLAWNAPLVATSLVLGLAGGAASMIAFHSRQGRTATVSAAVLLTLAICSLHFTSMGAVTIVPDPTVAFHASALDRPLLAMGTAGVTFVVLLSALSAAALQRMNNRCETALREQNARFEAALLYLPVGLSMFNSQQQLIMCNRAYREMYGLSEEVTRPGTSFEHIMRRHASMERDAGEVDAKGLGDWIDGLIARLAHGKAFTDPIQLSDGRTIFVRVGPIAGGGWVDVHEDITERSRQEAKIAHMARHDMLTGLPNRSLLHERLDLALNCSRKDEKVTLLFLDLDRFKEVNDTLGHRVGDSLLKAVAERLRDCVRKTDTVARVGGDEFVVMQATGDPSMEPEALASRIIEAISAPYEVEGHKLSIGTSVGIATSNGANADGETLIAQADLALYRSKNEGRGTFSFFEEEMNIRARRRHGLEQDLRSALANGEFELNYQPLVNLERNEISSFEALLRWRHKVRGLVSPVEFIPIAEETGLIIPIGEWVIRQACADAATWPAHIKVAVNLSPVQFKGRALVESVFNAVAAAGLNPSRLELEITESALLHDSEQTLAMLRKLHQLGVQIAMDDFGTGYSSLSYLRSFPFNKLKIDRCFIASLSDCDSSLAIVRAISGLGRALGLSITAEGVETQEQLDVIRNEGCTEMQGYLFSKAKSAGEIRNYFPALEQEPASAPGIVAA